MECKIAKMSNYQSYANSFSPLFVGCQRGTLDYGFMSHLYGNLPYNWLSGHILIHIEAAGILCDYPKIMLRQPKAGSSILW